MDLDLIYYILLAIVHPAWFLLIFLPKWKWTDKIVHYGWIPAILTLLYIAVFVSSYIDGQPILGGANMQTVDGVAAFLGSQYVALVAWIHLLTFDLFVGAWIVRDSKGLSIHPLIVAPCVILTYLFGPAGLFLYLLLRFAIRRTFSLQESTA